MAPRRLVVTPAELMPADVAARAKALGKTHRCDAYDGERIVGGAWGVSAEDAIASYREVSKRVSAARADEVTP